MKIVGYILGLVLVVLGFFGWAWFNTTVPQDASREVVEDIVVKEGDGLAEVTEQLEQKNIINRGTLFRYTMLLSGRASSIQVGNYALSPQESIWEIIEVLTSGQVTTEGTVTLPEGLTNDAVADILADYFVEHSTTAIASEEERQNFKDSFLAEMADLEKYRPDYAFLDDVPEGATLEGYLFPDTYRFFKETEPEVVIRKMLDNFDTKMTRDLRVEIAAQGKTIHEVVTLAAIVQKEVSGVYMKDVADIFYNRLEIGMKLQSDATVNYVTNSGRAQATFDDIAIDSPYNTYEYAGLPPGPISNPGFSALEATVFPAENDFFFFLTTLDTGEAIFSKTGAEHLENKAKYLD